MKNARAALPFLPAALCICFAGLNVVRVASEQGSLWFSGGLGMHSTMKGSPLWRFSRVYGLTPSGERIRLRRSRPRKDWIFGNHPNAENARQVLIDALEQPEAEESSYGSFEVELWEYTYPPGEPHLGARFVLTHELRPNDR